MKFTELSKKNILITGGAGLIGSSTALAVAEAGGIPIIADINDYKLTEISQKLKSSPHFCIKTDTTTHEGISSCIKKILFEFSQIHGAVHAAYPRSKGWGEPFCELKEEFLREDIWNQLGSSIIFSKIIMQYFKKVGEGNLVHLASIQGIAAPKFDHYIGTSMSSPIEYSAIKSGIIAITKWLAKYYKNNNIRVNCISPGGILDRQPESFLKAYRNDCLNIGMLNANDITSTIVYLLSENSRAINGQNIIIDDGWSL